MPGSSPGRGPGQQQQRCLQAPTRMSHTRPVSKPELASQRKTERGVWGTCSYGPALPANVTHQSGPRPSRAGGRGAQLPTWPAASSGCLYATSKLRSPVAAPESLHHPPRAPRHPPALFRKMGTPPTPRAGSAHHRGPLPGPGAGGLPTPARCPAPSPHQDPSALQGRGSEHTLHRLLIPELLALGRLTFTWSRGQAPSGEPSCPPS